VSFVYCAEESQWGSIWVAFCDAILIGANTEYVEHPVAAKLMTVGNLRQREHSVYLVRQTDPSRLHNHDQLVVFADQEQAVHQHHSPTVASFCYC